MTVAKDSWIARKRLQAWNWLIRRSKLHSRQGLYEFLETQCDLLPNGIRVLNVGSGGEVEALLREQACAKDWEFVSLDIDPNRNPDIVDSIERHSGDDGSYDGVFLVEVLEHVQRPESALANVLRLLRPSGRLVMSTPFLLPIHDAPADYFRFTEQGLRSLLEGFRDVCVNSRNGYFESINVLRMRALVSPQGRTTIVMAVALYSTSVGSHVARFLDRRLGIKEGTTGYTISAIKPGD